jgi:hypothetical protein
MATLDITLSDVSADSTISIRVQLHEDEKTQPRNRGQGDGAAERRRTDPTSAQKRERIAAGKAAPARLADRLRPTDKLVFDSLRARVPEGETETPPVRVQELMGECLISRRQVGICLRRLSEKGMITRVGEDTLTGREKGYRYRILT